MRYRRGLYEKKINIMRRNEVQLWILNRYVFTGIFCKRYEVSGLKCIFANGSGRDGSTNLNKRLNSLFAYSFATPPEHIRSINC